MKLLLLYDTNGWAWHHQARAIKTYAPKGLDVEIMSSHDFSISIANKPQRLREYTALFSFSWTEAPMVFGMNRMVSLLAHEGCMYHEDDLARDDWRAWSTSKMRNLRNARYHLPRFDALLAVNPALGEFAKTVSHDAAYIPAGVDHEYFRPSRSIGKGRKLTIAWSGQFDPKNKNTKCYEDVLLPLQAKLGDTFLWQINKSDARNCLSFPEVRRWYHSADIYLCTSLSEGTPMPPFEAAACGRAVVSTRVGAVPLLVDEEFLAPAFTDEKSAQHSIDSLASILNGLHNNREPMIHAGQRNRRRIEEQFTWTRLAPRWLSFIAGSPL